VAMMAILKERNNEVIKSDTNIEKDEDKRVAEGYSVQILPIISGKQHFNNSQFDFWDFV
jgi:hypothetical protein